MTFAAGIPLAFFRSRWRGEVPVARVFWLDMLVNGTAINVAALVGALLLIASDAPTALAMAVYFSPLPYNLFLCIAVWRCAEAADEPYRSAARLVGFAWLVLFFIV